MTSEDWYVACQDAGVPDMFCSSSASLSFVIAATLFMMTVAKGGLIVQSEVAC